MEGGFFQPIDPRIFRVVIFGMCFALTRWRQLKDDFTHEALVAQIQTAAIEGLVLR